MSAMVTMRTARHRLSAALTLPSPSECSGTISLTATHNSSSAADELQERVSHRLRDHEREQDAQHHGDAGAEDHAPEALPRRQLRQASAMTTALSPDRMMLTPMIWPTAIQNGALHDVLQQKVHRAPLSSLFPRATPASLGDHSGAPGP